MPPRLSSAKGQLGADVPIIAGDVAGITPARGWGEGTRVVVRSCTRGASGQIFPTPPNVHVLTIYRIETSSGRVSVRTHNVARIQLRAQRTGKVVGLLVGLAADGIVTTTWATLNLGAGLGVH